MVGGHRPTRAGSRDPNSNYGKYSYAGSCGTSSTTTACCPRHHRPELGDRHLGRQPIFQRGKNIVGGHEQPALRDAVPGQHAQAAGRPVAKAATTFYDNVYVRWFGPGRTVVGLLMFRYIWTGDLASMSKRGMWRWPGCWLAASCWCWAGVQRGWIPCCCSKTAQIQAGFCRPIRSIRNATRCRIRCTTTLSTQLAARGVRRPGRAAGVQFGPELLNDQAGPSRT